MSALLVLTNVPGPATAVSLGGARVERIMFWVPQASRMGLEGKRIAIERNGEIVPRGAFADTVLSSGDKLEIVGAVGGG